MITIRVDPRKALGYLNEIQERQLPYAVSLALNRIGNDSQAAERGRIKQGFKLRREDWNLKGVYISNPNRATKTSWRIVIMIQPNRDYLNKFEEGGFKVATRSKWLWQPNDSIFSKRIIGRADPLHPKNLHLQKNEHGQVVGQQRTFMVRAKSNHQLLVLQRIGPDQKHPGFTVRSITRLTLASSARGKGLVQKKASPSVRMLYRLVSKVRIPASLQFGQTVIDTVSKGWEARLNEAMDEAMRTAR